MTVDEDPGEDAHCCCQRKHIKQYCFDGKDDGAGKDEDQYEEEDEAEYSEEY